jgi:transposase
LPLPSITVAPNLVQALRRAHQAFSPPPALTVSQWADKHRQLSPEDSAEPGQWSTGRAEYLRGATLVRPGQFASGRHFAAWLRLTPRQHSSGGKDRLLGISKRGDAYLRRQLINGARAVVRVAGGKRGELWDWTNALRARRPFNVVVAAVANKLARVVWALCASGTECRWATAA